MKSGQLNIVGV